MLRDYLAGEPKTVRIELDGRGLSMNTMPDKLIIGGPADWRGAEMKARTDWIHHFDDAEVAEIEAALQHLKSKGMEIQDIASADDFPLDKVARRIEHARNYLEDEAGLFHFRGIPVDNRPKDDLRMIYWGIGRHLGTAVSQSDRGDLLGDVRNLGIDINSAKGRGYTSNARLSYHTDSADLVALMVLRVAKEGGLSMIASSVAIHNEVARTRPDLLEVLYQPMPWSWKGQEQEGQSPFYMQPIYSYHNGKFSSRYIRNHIISSQNEPEAPRLTDKQVEAMDYVDSLSRSEVFHFSMMFKPGDIQILNNHITYHSRTEFDDYKEVEERRHLLRMWLSVPNSRELSPLMNGLYRDVSAGAVRGGFPSRTGSHQYETARPPAD